jgi:DNA-binding NtrC family response regulator
MNPVRSSVRNPPPPYLRDPPADLLDDPLLRRLRDGAGGNLLVGRDPAFLREVRKIPVVANSDASVLLCGETGTGKEVCARAVHALSVRAASPFVAINCGALPVDLVENELFGHESEAYTGANTNRPGVLGEAQSGTLFLDEIDSLPAAAQVKLLRFLQEREYRPLGSGRSRKADVRILAATNLGPEELASGRALRRDLFYRLNVVSLRLPPLRERRDDIPVLADHFLSRWREKSDTPVRDFSPEAFDRLSRHDWPGNIRELEHVVERAVVFCTSDRIGIDDLDLPGSPEPHAPDRFAGSFRTAKARVVHEFERGYLERLLRAHRGNISQAASSARKNRRAFFELIRKHRIDVEVFRGFEA